MTLSVYTVPPDVAFMPALVDAILDGGFPETDRSPPDDFGLPDWKIFVPTRRSSRALAGAFLEYGDGRARLLPQIRPLGDIEPDLLEEETDADRAWDAPPAIPALARQFILTNLVEAWSERHPENELARSVTANRLNALRLADSLGKLIDRFDNDDVPFGRLLEITQENLAMHHQDALAFLTILTETYPQILASRGEVSNVHQRSDALRRQAAQLLRSSGSSPVIAAGSTGTIKATAELLGAIAKLENGAVILPGLDQQMDNQSWKAVDARHPQYGLKRLLAHIGLEREAVQILPGLSRSGNGAARSWLISETVRPSETTDQCRTIVSANSARLTEATNGIKLIEARDQAQEARVIALIMRRVLETGNLTAALITPDRDLGRQVKAELRRWSINIDDSAGEPLSRTPPARLLILMARASRPKLTSTDLVSLFNHPLTHFGMRRGDFLRLARLLETVILRRGFPLPSHGGLMDLVDQLRQSDDPRAPVAVKALKQDDWDELRDFAQTVLARLEPLRLAFEMPGRLTDLLKIHLETLEAVTEQPGEKHLAIWQGDDGEALADLLSAMLKESENCPYFQIDDYIDFLQDQLARKAVRSRVTHQPQLAIYGLLEARLIRPDVAILGGLNEDIWPPAVETDPWLNRLQKKQLDLQLPEQRIGLSAHDFVQAAGADQVWLTCAKKIQSRPALPSRWLQRLKALLGADDQGHLLTPEEDWTGWADKLSEPVTYEPIPPVAPRPSTELRPTRFSVTQIDRLLEDPYQIFVQKILKLEELDRLDPVFSARERGNALHAALHRLIREHPVPGVPPSADGLIELAAKNITAMPGGGDYLLEWLPRLRRLAHWFIGFEQERRAEIKKQWTEVSGSINFELNGRTFELHAKADRIDLMQDGLFIPIDYKTSSVEKSFEPSASEFSAQLLLEAAILYQGGFKDVPAGSTGDLLFIHLIGGNRAGSVKSLKPGDRDEVVGQAFSDLCRLLVAYEDPEQPYLPIVWTRDPDRLWTSDHLSRWREWGHVDPEGPDR